MRYDDWLGFVVKYGKSQQMYVLRDKICDIF